MASHAWLIHTAFIVFLCIPSDAQLSPAFYNKTCPIALGTIKNVIRSAISKDRRMAASLIRLHFHDCFVQGCDASVLLDDSPSINSEVNALQNKGFRGQSVIANAKAELEKICPGTVSCADILTVAARDASFAAGGPSWTVKLGRRDSTTADAKQAETELPKFFYGMKRLIDMFDRKGLSARDMVALFGTHTKGQTPCVTFRQRVYSNASVIDADFASTRRCQCPITPPNGDLNLAPFDLETPDSLYNNYFKNLIQKKGLLESDQVLFSGGSTDSIVKEYSENPSKFCSDYAIAMVKLGDILPLTGSQGIIRKFCNVIN